MANNQNNLTTQILAIQYVDGNNNTMYVEYDTNISLHINNKDKLDGFINGVRFCFLKDGYLEKNNSSKTPVKWFSIELKEANNATNTI